MANNLMLISQMSDGLGNQLFQYSTALSLAKRLGTSVWLDIGAFHEGYERSFALDAFSISGRILPSLAQWFYSGGVPKNRFKRTAMRMLKLPTADVSDCRSGFDASVFDIKGSFRLTGYWQSESYFLGIRGQLLNELHLRKSLSIELQPLISKMTSEESVAVHVRRGDFLTNSRHRFEIGTLTRDYYAKALRIMKRVKGTFRLFIFSDDIEWVLQNIPESRDAIMVSSLTRSATEDLVLMSHCRHFVIANSTFSWWGAWLSQNEKKLVIAPSKFFRIPQPWEHDLVPKEWLRIDNDFCGD